jgi:hypothetical protein
LIAEFERHIDVESVIDENDFGMFGSFRVRSNENVSRMRIGLNLRELAKVSSFSRVLMQRPNSPIPI